MVEQLEEVPKTMSHNEIQRRTAEQIVDLPAPVFTERISARILGLSAFIEAAKTPRQDWNLQRTVEQITVDYMDEAMSQIMDNVCEQRGLPRPQADAGICNEQLSRTLSR